VDKVFAPPRGEPVRALSDVNLEIPEGEFVSVLGPSGCGKSTLLTIVAGLEPPTGGLVQIGGEVISGPYTPAGIVFQRDLLLEWRNVLDNILLQFELRGLKAAPHKQRARDLLDLVGIADFADRYPRELSGGMRQRVGICRALAHDPGLLLMDEPFGALDALTREQLNDDLAHICSQTQKSVMFITHSIAEAVFLGDRVVIMSARPGRIIEDFKIELARPRLRELRNSSDFSEYVHKIRDVLFADGIMH
jgi:NitT/TauT family transport system ATP-binding protein